jgi:AcrR family transcriptional regulator
MFIDSINQRTKQLKMPNHKEINSNRQAGSRSVGRPTREQAKALSETILRVAQKHFLKNGYQDTNLDDIAADARTTKNAIYSRFTDKATLFARVCADIIESHYLEDVATPDDELPLRESLVKRALAIVDAAIQPEAVQFYKLITYNTAAHPEIRQSTIPVWNFYVSQFETYFQSRINKGLIHMRNPRIAAETYARMALSPIHIALVHGMDLPDHRGMEKHIKEVSLVFLGGFGRLELEGHTSTGES